MLTQFNPNFKKFLNKPSGNFRSQSYQHPHHYNKNSGDLQGGNHSNDHQAQRSNSQGSYSQGYNNNNNINNNHNNNNHPNNMIYVWTSIAQLRMDYLQRRWALIIWALEYAWFLGFGLKRGGPIIAT